MHSKYIYHIFILSKKQKHKKMKIIATQNDGSGNQIIFTWNEDLTTCDFVSLGIVGTELDDLLDRMMLCGTHEGRDYKGWTIAIA